MKTVFLSGFLGLAEDWKLIQQLPSGAVCRSLWKDMETLKDNATFDSWVDIFLSTTPPGLHAFGYSLGARLLLHAYIKKPSHFSALTLFSCHFGLQSAEDKKQRVENDRLWAKRFLTEDWESLQDAWNSQAVFQGSPHLQRQEADFDRKLLSQAMLAFSLGKQSDLSQELPQDSSTPLHFVVGEKDTKFVSLLKAIPSQNNHFTYVLKGAGHRIPWGYTMTGQEKWWHQEP